MTQTYMPSYQTVRFFTQISTLLAATFNYSFH